MLVEAPFNTVSEPDGEVLPLPLLETVSVVYMQVCRYESVKWIKMF